MDASSMSAAAQPAPVRIAGPRDRESFFEAQRRNRRATWRLAAVSAIATVVMGIPLALTITPLLYAAALIVADIVNIWLPLPPSFWQRASEFARYGVSAIQWLAQAKIENARSLVLGAAVLLLPGAMFSVALWLAVNALFRRAGVGGALLALKAREPNSSELKELQLSDVVQEMAIAAGLPAPRILVIDAPAANAAAIGTCPTDARIVVSRGLVEQLNRDELEGALAHLVASIGNGDLRIAFRVTSVFETCGLLVAVVNSPFGSRARRTLWRILRYGLGPKKNTEARTEEAAGVAELLTRGAGLENDDIDTLFDTTTSRKSVVRSVRNFLLFPIFLTNTAMKLSLWFFSLSILQPSMALLWRKRIYLADASAVQLTRNPDGLAQALRKLNSDRGPIPGAAWASNLFLVNPAGSGRVNDPQANAAHQQVLARMWATSQARPGDGSSSPTSASLPFVTQEIFATGRAAIAGDQDAIARIAAFRQAAAAELGTTPDELPGLADLAAAQRGDKEALRRLQEFTQKTKGAPRAQIDSKSPSDTSTSGFAGFHPSLKRRLKRLDRMGAHVQLESGEHKTWIVVAALSLFLGPFALLALVLFLLLIAMMTMASLAFLAIWMAVIHKLFLIFARH